MAIQTIDNRIKLTLVGLASEDGHIRADDLQQEFRLLLSILQKGECDLLGTRERAIYYRVIELHHSSPATIVLEARPLKTDHDRRREFLPQLGSVVREVRQGRLSRKVEPSLLQDLRNMAAPIGRTLAGVILTIDNSDVEFTPDVRKNVEAILSPEEVFNGSFSGMLEYLNVHAGANVFCIYPDVGPTKIRCHFPAELTHVAIKAIGEFVEIRGVLKYKCAAPYPHEIVVGDVIVHSQEDLPTFADMRGIARLPAGTTSEEFVRKIRDAL
jgi:hypothetical protein